MTVIVVVTVMVVVIVSEVVGSTGHMHSGRSKNCHRDSNSRGNNKMMVLVICGRRLLLALVWPLPRSRHWTRPRWEATNRWHPGGVGL